MLKFIWDFNSLRIQQQQNDCCDVMVSVKYRLCATDRHRSVYRYGAINFAPADPDYFTPYNEITNETMIVFVEQTLGESLDALKSEMIAEHAESPIDIRPMPWESAEETEQ